MKDNTKKIELEAATNHLAPLFSEEAIALEFATWHSHLSRYVAAWGKWLRYDGKRWNFDQTRETFSLARNLCREISAEFGKDRERKSIASAKTRAAVVGLAGEDRSIAATVDQWDADLWSLNTPSGVVDLKTGIIRPQRPEDYMTKITAVAPDANCPTPLWVKFLAVVTADDKDLKAFLQRMSGYSLTGITTEHALFFLYGEGRNGKGVFMNTLSGIVSSYHRVAPMEMFTASKYERHLTEVARLMGARMVTASETEKGKFWNESRIKQFTGGDPLAANFMRQDHFEFMPQFKLIFSGNHKPRLKSVDAAIQSRMNLIPFLVTIPETDRDPNLLKKLEVEWPGILAWMIAGCVSWQKIGLAAPEIVRKATEEYLKAEDAIMVWFESTCVLDPSAFTATADLYASWKEYATVNNEYLESERGFSQSLEKIPGLRKDRKDGKRGFIGVKFGAPPKEPEPM